MQRERSVRSGERFVLVLGLLAALVAAAAGCSDSGSDDGRTVAGRTGSASPSVVAPDVAALTSLRLVTTTDGGVTTARAEATLVVQDARGAALRLPGGAAEQRLLADPADPTRFALAVDGAPADVEARFPAGTYAFVIETAQGAQPAVAVVLEPGPGPAAPAVLGPPDGATGVGAGPTIAWSAPGPTFFDVSVVDDATGASAYAATDVLGTTHALPPGTLAPGRTYRLALAASAAGASAGARREARTVTRFTTAGAP